MYLAEPTVAMASVISYSNGTKNVNHINETLEENRGRSRRNPRAGHYRGGWGSLEQQRRCYRAERERAVPRLVCGSGSNGRKQDDEQRQLWGVCVQQEH